MALTHHTIQQALADAVRERIISGELPAGSRIDQDALAAEFSVSRMPIREALRQLGAEGFVTIVPHRGAIVTALSPDEVEQIYEIRAALEGVTARYAAANLTDGDLENLQSTLAALGDERQIDRWVALNAEFHDTINRASGRPRLLELIQRFREQSQPYIRLYVERLHQSEQARREHRSILEALRARDPDAAEAAVRQHLLSTGRAVTRLTGEASAAEL